jgi:hypothetical protein
MDWTYVASRISDDDRGKWDRTVSGADLGVDGSGNLTVGSTSEPIDLSDLATNQLCERLSIPPTYYRRLPAPMRATVANFDLARLADHQFLLRGKATRLRALLSAGYVAYDNAHIVEVTESLLRNGNLTIKAFVLEETRSYLKVVSEDLADPTSGLKPGVLIGNSEVGLGSVSVEPFVYRRACTNDLVVSASAFKHAHIHLTPNELSRRMAKAIGETFRVACEILDGFLKAKCDPVPDPVALIRTLAEERKLSQKLTDEVVGRYVAEPEANRFGVVNAFTGAAQTLAPLQRIEMERFAGHLLTAPLGTH